MSYQIEEAGSTCQPDAPHTGTVAVMAALLARVAGTTNLGVYNCRQIHGSRSLSLHSVWRAGDTGTPSQTAETPQGLAVVALLLLHAEALQVQRFIHARRIWDCERGFHPYTGSDPHFNHVHWELTHYGAALDAAHVSIIFETADPTPAPKPKPKPPEEPDIMFIAIDPRGSAWLIAGGVRTSLGTNADIVALTAIGIKQAHLTDVALGAIPISHP